VVPEESKAQLIDAARLAGFGVSARQITRWHVEGLLPKPVQRPRHGDGGSETFYAPGTAKQLIALLERLKNDRRLAEAGWHLWWNGYSVDERYWRGSLSDLAESWNNVFDLIQEASWKGDEIIFSDRFFDVVTRLKAGTRPGSLFAHFRRRVGADNLESALALLFKFAGGDFETTFFDAKSVDYQKDAKILNNALGFTRMKFSVLNVSPWLTGSILPILINASKILSDEPLSEVLSGATAEQILCARDQLRLIFSVISLAAENLEKLAGKHALGLSVAGEIFRSDDKTVQAGMLLGILALKKNIEYDNSISRFADLAKSNNG
jgi:hypothetical protein